MGSDEPISVTCLLNVISARTQNKSVYHQEAFNKAIDSLYSFFLSCSLAQLCWRTINSLRLAIPFSFESRSSAARTSLCRDLLKSPCHGACRGVIAAAGREYPAVLLTRWTGFFAGHATRTELLYAKFSLSLFFPNGFVANWSRPQGIEFLYWPNRTCLAHDQFKSKWILQRVRCSKWRCINSWKAKLDGDNVLFIQYWEDLGNIGTIHCASHGENLCKLFSLQYLLRKRCPIMLLI